MWFSELERQDRILQTVRTIQSRLAQTRTAIRADRDEQAETLVQESLKDLIGVIQHVQHHYAVAPIPHPHHEAVVLWLDRTQLARLQELSTRTGLSPRQCLIDLIQHGRLPADDQTD